MGPARAGRQAEWPNTALLAIETVTVEVRDA